MMIERSEVIRYVNTVVGQPFEWGVLDCTLFPAFCLDALLGQTLSAAHSNQWHDIRSAVEYSIKNDLTLSSWLSDNGCNTIPKNYQQTGDFLMIETLTVQGHAWLSAGVCLGAYTAVCTEEGVALFKTHHVKHNFIMGIR